MSATPAPQGTDAPRPVPIPIGHVTQVQGPVIVVRCDLLPPLRQALVARTNGDRFVFEVHQHLDKQHVRAIILHRSAGLQRGTPVYDTGSPLHVPMSPHCLGRVLNVFGEPIDGAPPFVCDQYRNIHSAPLPLNQISSSEAILQTGIKVIDLLKPVSDAFNLAWLIAFNEGLFDDQPLESLQHGMETLQQRVADSNLCQDSPRSEWLSRLQDWLNRQTAPSP